MLQLWYSIFLILNEITFTVQKGTLQNYPFMLFTQPQTCGMCGIVACSPNLTTPSELLFVFNAEPCHFNILYSQNSASQLPAGLVTFQPLTFRSDVSEGKLD